MRRPIQLAGGRTRQALYELTGLIRRSRSNLSIGTYGGTRARFQGLLAEVRLYNRPPSAAEIAKLAAE